MPAPPLPAALAARLQAVLAQESGRRRRAGQGAPTAHPSWSGAHALRSAGHRPGHPGRHRTTTPHRQASLGHFGHELHHPTLGRRAALALVAAAVNSADLAAAARSLEAA